MTELQECVFCLQQVERLPHLCQQESDARLATLHSLAEAVISKGRECKVDLDESKDYEVPDWLELLDLIESLNIGLGSAMAAERMVRSRLEKAVCQEVIQDMLDVHLCAQREPSLGGMNFEPAMVEYAKYHFQMDRPAYAKELPEHFKKLGELLQALGEVKQQ